MYTYLGASRSARDREVVGFFDMDTATIAPPTRELLARAQKDGKVTAALDPGDIPRSFVVTADGSVILTEASVSLLRYRSRG